jgi:hypothetical protein
MTLSFSTTMNGKPNFFIEKIWESILNERLSDQSTYQNYRFDYNEKLKKDYDQQTPYNFNIKPKRHTIREDQHDRWGAGTNIHMVINNRTANRFQFAPLIKCISTQQIVIIDADNLSQTIIEKMMCYRIKTTVKGIDFYNAFKVWVGDPVNGKFLTVPEIQNIAVNDGFESAEAFLTYFKTDKVYKLIHWTPLKY